MRPRSAARCWSLVIVGRRATASRKREGHSTWATSYGLAAAPPPGRRRHANHLLEGAAEGRLRLVANVGGYAGEICFAARQELRRNLHPPFCEVVHGRTAYQLRKAFGENRARHACFSCQFVNSPVVRRASVH